jgi:hypothetical protein
VRPSCTSSLTASSGSWTTYSDYVVSYVDAGGVLNRIRIWAEIAIATVVDKRQTQALSLLLVSGIYPPQSLWLFQPIYKCGSAAPPPRPHMTPHSRCM